MRRANEAWLRPLVYGLAGETGKRKVPARSKPPRMIVGLTGSMGSGKSTASTMMEAIGYQRLDSDAIVRDELLRHPEVVAAVAQELGPGVLLPTGLLDRGAMARIVFGDDARRLWLEELLHPRLFAFWRQSFAASPAQSWVVEVPLLFEKELENWFDFTVCVASSSDLQLARLEKRGIPHALAEQRISKQLPLATKLERADFVLWNDGSLSFLREQVEHLHGHLVRLARL